MTNSYENVGLIKRVWNRVFHKRKLLPAPVQYTQKEVKIKMQEILEFLKYRCWNQK